MDDIFKPESPSPTQILEAIAARARQEKCGHASVMPDFDESASEGLDEYEVRRRWPRFVGECPDCHGRVILYASFTHFLRGDW